MSPKFPDVIQLIESEKNRPIHEISQDVCEEKGINQRTFFVQMERKDIFLLLCKEWEKRQFNIVHVHDDKTQFFVLLWRFLYRKPFSVVRSWYAPKKIKRGFFSKWLYFQKTDVNVFENEEVRKEVWVPNQYKLDYFDVSQGESLARCYKMLSGDVLDRPGYEHIKLTYVSHFYCNQSSIDSVLGLLKSYAGFSEELRRQIQFVIVDDGSPVDYAIPDLPLNLIWIKINEDIRWNQAGARNVGVVYAKSDNVLITDIDHYFPESSLKDLVGRGSCGKVIYKLWRKDDQGQYQKPHPNIFFLSRGRFFECHGYDEQFAGRYGAEDVRFIKYHKAMGTLPRLLSKKIWCRDRSEIDRKKSYHSLTRDLSGNTPVDARKTLELKYYGNGFGHSRSFLNFTWKVLLDKRLEGPMQTQSVNMLWKWGMGLRQILPRGYR
ncbi:glycosyltransferase family A protein [Crenobacter luteus]|uniref:glycosyltransferase family A protein n=1 Tax=Crenobacter luteus TaxID=1452487 RepID=UPI0012E77DE9|nr:glycosyltransferase family A protein [Crenobacter luteus]